MIHNYFVDFVISLVSLSGPLPPPTSTTPPVFLHPAYVYLVKTPDTHHPLKGVTKKQKHQGVHHSIKKQKHPHLVKAHVKKIAPLPIHQPMHQPVLHKRVIHPINKAQMQSISQTYQLTLQDRESKINPNVLTGSSIATQQSIKATQAQSGVSQKIVKKKKTQQSGWVQTVTSKVADLFFSDDEKNNAIVDEKSQAAPLNKKLANLKSKKSVKTLKKQVLSPQPSVGGVNQKLKQVLSMKSSASVVKMKKTTGALVSSIQSHAVPDAISSLGMKMIAPDASYRVPAKLTAKMQVIMSSPMAGQIKTLSVSEGDYFQKGDALLSFDCVLAHAKLKKAMADAILSRVNYSSSQRLEAMGSIGKMQVAKSQAEYIQAMAGVDIADHQVKDCVVKAPFSGQVTDLYVHPYQTVSASTQLFQLVDTHDLLVKLSVPSTWLSWLKQGAFFKLQVKGEDKIYTGQVVRVISSVDGSGMMVKLVGKVVDAHPALQAGMDGVVAFSNPLVKG